MFKQPADPNGNIFGWRLSLIGAFVIAAFLALAAYRHQQLDVPTGFEDPLENKRIQDSIREEQLRETSRPPQRSQQ